jgi:hypothetical protein
MGIGSSRRKAKPIGWLRDTINGIYTVDKITEDWWKMEPKDRLTIRAALEPKHNINDNNDLQVHIILTGITDKKIIQGQVVDQKALTDAS